MSSIGDMIGKQLTSAAKKAGPGVPLKIGLEGYARLRMELMRDFKQETKVEWLRAGFFGRWKGRAIFVTKDAGNEPSPYPEGDEIINEIRKRKKGIV